MKKIVIYTVVIGIVGILCFSSYKIVDGIRVKAINAEVSSKIKSTKTAESEQSENGGDVGQNFTEQEKFLPQNQGTEFWFGSDSPKGDLLDFSSAEDFIRSYKGYDVNISKEEIYYSNIKSMVCLNTYDEVEVVEYLDGGIYEVRIEGDVANEIGGKIDESKYSIKEVNGVTIISLNSSIN